MDGRRRIDGARLAIGNFDFKRTNVLGDRTVTASRTNRLKLYDQRYFEPPRPDIENVASLPSLKQAFEEVTGWSLKYCRGSKPIHPTEYAWSAPANPGVGATLGHVQLSPVRSASAASDPPPGPVCRLVAAIDGLVTELLTTQQALIEREAELAAAIPVVIRSDERNHLARRLRAVLRGGAEAVGCHAAALYLLDEATTTLKLRCSWGLPRDRLARPPRPLRGALADLEAMLGHAVVLEDVALFQQWNPPEIFASAACVPVATPTNILGTLWVFCNARRDFNDRETNMLEMVAGRLASDLEREILVQEGAEAAQIKRQLDAAERIQRHQLPSVPPMIRGWDFAGWALQSSGVGGCFFDWFSLPRSSVAFALGEASGTPLEAAMIASSLRALLRSHGQYHRNADRLLTQVNLTQWTSSAGDQAAAVSCGFVDATSDRIRLASTGNAGAILVRSDSWQSLASDAPVLGQSPESVYRQTQLRLRPGDTLFCYTSGLRAALHGPTNNAREAWLAQWLAARLNLTAKGIANAAREEIVDSHLPDLPDPEGAAILVLRRTKP